MVARNKTVKEYKFPVVVENPFFGIVEKNGKYQQGYQHQKELTADSPHISFGRSQIILVFGFEGIQYLYLFGSNQFTLGDDNIALLHHAFCETDTFQVVQVFDRCFRGVEFQVWLQIVVQVQA